MLCPLVIYFGCDKCVSHKLTFFPKVFSSGTIKMRPQIKYPNYANTCPCAFCRLRANLTQNMKLRDTQLSRPCIIQNIRGHKSRLNAPHYRGFLSSLVISVKWFLAPHKSALTYSQDQFQSLCVVMHMQDKFDNN